jgi:hypothetical protein
MLGGRKQPQRLEVERLALWDQTEGDDDEYNDDSKEKKEKV